MPATEDRAVRIRAAYRKILVAVNDSPFRAACSTAVVAVAGRDDERTGCTGRSARRVAVQPAGHAR